MITTCCFNETNIFLPIDAFLCRRYMIEKNILVLVIVVVVVLHKKKRET